MELKSQNKSSPALIFIPDISGFTDFVSNTEITHSQHIIQELLEEIIDTNEIGLEISEIEGDAILFYRLGDAPTTAKILAQVQRMYTRFHSILNQYQTHRICYCGACMNTNKLSLKFVIHYGEIIESTLKDFRKIFGKDLIVAHRLMKNEVPHKEYVLFTNQLLSACSSWVSIESIAWAKPHKNHETYDFGTIDYCYLTLEELKKHITPIKKKNHLTPNAENLFLVTEKVIAAPIELVFSVLTDLKFRAQWIPYLKDSDHLNSKIPVHGSTHRCLITGNESDPFFISHSYDIKKDLISFIESENKMKLNVFYKIRRISDGLTRIEREDCFKNGILNKIIFLLQKKKKYKKWINTALMNFKEYCEKLDREGKNHSSEIILPKL